MTNKNEQRKVPELRFPEFSGEWEERKLNEIASFYKGKGISKSDISEEGVNCILYGELYTKYGFQINKVYSRTNINENNLFEGFKNDVLIPSSGETAIDIATASNLNVNNTYLGGDINVIRPNDEYNGHFVSLSINGKNKKELSKLAQGKTVVHLYNNELKKLKINFPSIKEQEKIGEFFSKLDRQIELEEKKLALLEEQKKGYMQKIFSQELRFKDENGEEYPEWVEKQVKDLGKIITGNTPSKSESDYWENGEIPWITPSDISSKKEIYISQSMLSKKGFSKARKLPAGTLLITCIASIGKNAILTKRGSCNQQINAVISNSNFDVDFLYYLFETKKQYLESISGKTATSIINKSNFENIIVMVPILNEQREISLFLSGIDNKLNNIKKKIKYLKLRKKIFINKIFV